MTGKSIDLVLLELMEKQINEKRKNSDGSLTYELQDKRRALSISLGKYDDGRFCVLVYHKGNLVYIARKENDSVVETRHEKGDWEEKARDLARQQTFQFFNNVR